MEIDEGDWRAVAEGTLFSHQWFVADISEVVAVEEGGVVSFVPVVVVDMGSGSVVEFSERRCDQCVFAGVV